MQRPIKAALGAVMVLGLGLAAWCCGPKVAPELEPRCPEESCALDAEGQYTCTCPEVPTK